MPQMADVMVVKQIELAPLHYRLTLAAPEAAREARPGQFLHVRCGETLDPLLRRPVSIHAADRERGELTLLYRVAGRGTALLSKKKKGDLISLLGPLGRGFTMPSAAEKVAVVAGGIGMAPLYFLLQEIGARGQSALVFWGAPAGGQFFSSEQVQNNGVAGETLSVVREISAQGHQIVLATDDGSAGFHGTVTDLFGQYLNSPGGREELLSHYGDALTARTQLKTDRESNGVCGCGPGGMLKSSKYDESDTFARVYGCGPRGMMQEFCRIIGREKIPGEISLEERMGCGVGACLSCACKTREEKDGFRYSRACVEGPVFSAGEVFWD